MPACRVLRPALGDQPPCRVEYPQLQLAGFRQHKTDRRGATVRLRQQFSEGLQECVADSFLSEGSCDMPQTSTAISLHSRIKFNTRMDNTEARIQAEVEKRLAAVVAEQQKQFATTLEMVMKNAVGGVEQSNAGLEKERKKLEKELDAARELHAKAEREGEKMASEAFEKHRKQYEEAARLELLRKLTRMHIEVGKTTRDIAVWLDVPQEFVENIRRIVQSVEKYRDGKQRKPLEGNPKVRFTSQGRGGTVFFESRETKFDMWWEMGYTALIIVEIPTEADWVSRTNLPLERREETLNFIGEELVLQEVPYGGSFIVGENIITIYGEEK